MNVYISLWKTLPITILNRFLHLFLVIGDTVVAYQFRLMYHLQIKQALRCFRYLTTEIFSCFLQPAYPDNFYLFERRIHIQKKCLLQVLTKMHNSIKRIEMVKKCEKDDLHILVLNKLDLLFDITMDYAQLRQRVTDYADFKLCHKEMFDVLVTLERFFSALLSLKKDSNYFIELKEKIQQFEEIYQHVLTVTTRDPFIFLMFISALKLLDENMASLQESLLCLVST